MEGAGNLLSTIALWAWLPITAWIFTRFPPTPAAIVSILAGITLLPERISIQLPLVSPLTKGSIIPYAVMWLCLFKARPQLSRAKPFRGFDLWFVLMLLGDIGTVATNIAKR